jgi:hypothetical protein
MKQLSIIMAAAGRLFQQLSALLRQACYADLSWGFQLRQALALGLFVFLFLSGFRPFQLDSLQHSVGLAAAGFGAVTAAVMLLMNLGIPALLPTRFDEERWTAGKQLAWTLGNIFVIGLFNFLFFSFAYLGGLSLNNLLWFQAYTLAVGIFPVSILTLWKNGRDSEKYQSAAVVLNQKMRRPERSAAQTDEDAAIEIPSQNLGEESLLVPLRSLLYIRAAGNYLEVFHHHPSGGISKSLIRNTLKTVEEKLGAHPCLFRCHKSYLANLLHLERASGNAQGYKLHLVGAEDPIPVSRQHNETIKTKLAR